MWSYYPELLSTPVPRYTSYYIHVDEALKLAVRRTSDEIARLLAQGAAKLDRLRLAT